MVNERVVWNCGIRHVKLSCMHVINVLDPQACDSCIMYIFMAPSFKNKCFLQISSVLHPIAVCCLIALVGCGFFNLLICKRLCYPASKVGMECLLSSPNMVRQKVGLVCFYLYQSKFSRKKILVLNCKSIVPFCSQWHFC